MNVTSTWYPFYVGDYARDTSHLSMLEHGAFRLLMDYCYSTGKGLPGNASGNATLLPNHCRSYRIANATTKEEQEAVDNVIEMFFDLHDDGMYHNKKIKKVIEEQEEKREKRSKAGKLGAQKKHGKAGGNAKAMPKQSSSKRMANQNQNQNKYPPTPRAGSGDADSPGTGSFKKGGFGGSYKVDHLLNDQARLDAKAHAPGWDLYTLMRIYDEGINSGDREAPRYPNKAFPIWCKNYTKGKKP